MANTDPRGPVVIRTPRLIMRAAASRSRDLEGLHVAMSNPEVMRYWSTPAHTERSETEEWITAMTASACNGVTDFLICLRTSNGTQVDVVAESEVRDEEVGPTIGKIGIWARNEIGFLLGREHWGRGLAREALTAMLDYLFFEYQDAAAVRYGHDAETPDATESGVDSEGRFDWIMTDVDPRNAASLGLLATAGFTKYGFAKDTLQVGDEWVDSVYLSLWRDEWARRRHGVHGRAVEFVEKQ